jgi:hypothetical protein
MKAVLQVIVAIILVMIVWGLVKWIMAMAFILLWKVALLALFVGLVYVIVKAMNRQKVSW